MEYSDFLQSKTHSASMGGFDPIWMPEKAFDFQQHLIEWATRKGRAALFVDTGLGKAQPVNEIVLTPDGWVEIGSLKIGDKVIGSNGSPSSVIGVFPQGRRSVSKVVFSDGAQCRADDEHLWSVKTDLDASRGLVDRILSTRQIADSIRQPSGRSRWRVPMVSIVGSELSLPVDPYILGVLIGDGSLAHGTSPSFTSADDQIPLEVNKRLPPEFRCVTKRPADGRTPSHWICREAGHGVGSSESVIMSGLRGVGLWGCRSNDKFIPKL